MQARLYKFRKGDTLQKVAKGYGHGDLKVIWADKQNAALKKKRGQPEALQPGDQIVIPPTKLERAALAAQAATKDAEGVAELELATKLEGWAETCERGAGRLKKAAAEVDKAHDAVIAALKAALTREGDPADLARTLAGQAKGVAKGAKGMAMELAKLGAEMARSVQQLARGPHMSVLKSSSVKKLLKEAAADPFAPIQDVAESWGKLIQPAAWSPLVADAPAVKAAIARMGAQKGEQGRALREAVKGAEARAKLYAKEAKAAQTRGKAGLKAAKDLRRSG